MSFRGALLKPSEKNGTARTAKASKGISKASRYEVLKEKIRNWWEDRFKVGAALQEIRDQKLYRSEHETFEEFCQSEYGFERAHAYRLIGFAEVKASVQMSPMGDKIQNERQARALKPVPVEQRAEVVERAAEKGEVTAKTITEAAREVVPPQLEPPTGKTSKEDKPQRLDKTGYPIPDAVIAEWDEAEAFRATLNALHKIKIEVEKALDRKVRIYRFADQSAVIDLQNAWRTLQQIIPYAVCPTCQGRTKSKCSACKGMGYVPEFGYKHWFAKEVIELRERAIKK